MKKTFLMTLVIAAVCASFTTGCTSVVASKVGKQVSVYMPAVIQPEIETKNNIIRGTATVHILFGFLPIRPSEQAVGVNYGINDSSFILNASAAINENIARNAAAYDAIAGAEADIILAPQYVITTKNYLIFKSITCKVKGFPGYIKGVKVLDCQNVDAKFLEN